MLTARVIVWDKDHQNEIVTDIRNLISSHPEDTRFGYVLARLALPFVRRGEYDKAKKFLEAGRKISGELGVNPGFGFLVSAYLELKLGNPGKAKTYAEKACKAYKLNGTKVYYEMGHLFLGYAYSSLGQHEKSIDVMKQTLDSRSISTRFRSHSFLASTYLLSHGQTL